MLSLIHCHTCTVCIHCIYYLSLTTNNSFKDKTLILDSIVTADESLSTDFPQSDLPPAEAKQQQYCLGTPCSPETIYLPWASPPEVSTAIARPTPIFVGSVGLCCAMVLELKLTGRKRPRVQKSLPPCCTVYSTRSL